MNSSNKQVRLAGRSLTLSEEGFLQETDAWTEDIARALARDGGLHDMNADHWTVVRFIRDYYLQFGLAPSVRKLCVQTGIHADDLYQLFEKGPAKDACRIAGLPNADGCV